MVVAVVPVLGRYPLVPYTLRRLNKIVDKVICVVDNKRDRQICADEGAFIVNAPGVLLGKKWNAGFWEAKQFDPDFVLYMGSSDWVSDNYLDVMLPIAQDYEITGTLDYHLLHLEYNRLDDDNNPISYQEKRYRFMDEYDLDLIRENFISREVKHWKGYECERKGEPIGIGRLVRRDYLDRVRWNPFEDSIYNSLDWSMFQKASHFKAIMSDEAQSMSVSTSLWGNKHTFDGDLIDESYLTKWFPEALKLF